MSIDIDKHAKMNKEQKKRMDGLERRLHYGRGLTMDQWDELIGLRRIDLEERGFNPNDYDLSNKYCKRKYA